MSGIILVIEDNPDNRKLIIWVLEEAGYRCEEAGSAEEGLALLAEKRVDLVLMDISLPGMQGTQATQQLRAMPQFATLPIIAVTAHAISSEEERILAAGVSALVTKPIDENALLHAIETVLAPEAQHD